MNSSRLKRAYDMIPTNSSMALADDTSMAARKFLCVHEAAHIMTARTRTVSSGAQHRVALMRCMGAHPAGGDVHDPHPLQHIDMIHQ